MAFGGSLQLKMSDQSFDFICTACSRSNKIVEAVKYCIECSGYCCQSCTDIHNNFPTLSGHNISDITSVNQTSGQPSTLTEFPIERCHIHPSKLVDMYCQQHDDVGCYVCFAKNHKSCDANHIHSIPEMIDTIFNPRDCKRTHSLLKKMMVSMETVEESADVKLELLDKAREDTHDKVTTFQKALEALVRKAADSTRNEVDAAYNEERKKILQEKQTAATIRNDLEATDTKLDQSAGNRAEKFVSSKQADENIKEAEKLKCKHDPGHTAEITFVPNQSLMTYLQQVQGIGHVQHRDRMPRQVKQDQVLQSDRKQQKQGLYKVRQGRDIALKLKGDSSTCWARGSCLTDNNQLLVTDFNNKKLKRIDIHNANVVDYCTLDASPVGVCCVGNNEVAVACQDKNKIQFISIQNQLTPTRQIAMSRTCYGIACRDDKLYVTNEGASLFVYDIGGTLLKTITNDSAGNGIFTDTRLICFDQRGDTMFVADWYKGVVCFDRHDQFVSYINDTDLKGVLGIGYDDRGSIFTVGYYSHNVVQFTDGGKKVGVVVKREDGVNSLTSVCYHHVLNQLFVTQCYNNSVKVFELE